MCLLSLLMPSDKITGTVTSKCICFASTTLSFHYAPKDRHFGTNIFSSRRLTSLQTCPVPSSEPIGCFIYNSSVSRPLHMVFLTSIWQRCHPSTAGSASSVHHGCESTHVTEVCPMDQLQVMIF